MVRLRTAVIFEGNLAFQVWDVADPARIFRASATSVLATCPRHAAVCAPA